MGAIIPAIVPVSRKDLEDRLARLSGLCSDVQIDIADGHFAGPATWPYAEDIHEPSRMLAQGEMFPHCDEFRIEIDLMSAEPEAVAGPFIGLCATRLTVHAESTRYLTRFIDDMKQVHGHDRDFVPELLSVGVAIGIDTDLALLKPYLPHVAYVQFMGIKTIGHQGEPFDPRVLQKVKAFKRLYPDIPLQVDGGVTKANAGQLLSAGVSRLVVGSALWKAPNLAAELREFNAIAETYGLYD
ncbi:MAG: ribulose-phosphate 3-epimerase [Parcubacteria bacterium C7867-004]|nr:MAG: ribulose-phosphate 3-epimerase [Parcubacteria bacterium C7867-004]